MKTVRLVFSFFLLLICFVVEGQNYSDSFEVYRNYPIRDNCLPLVHKDTVLLHPKYNSPLKRNNHGYSYFLKPNQHAITRIKDSLYAIGKAIQVIKLQNEYITINSDVAPGNKKIYVLRIDTFGNTFSTVAIEKSRTYFTDLTEYNSPTGVNSYGVLGDTLFISSTQTGHHLAFAYDLKSDTLINFDFDWLLEKFPLITFPNALTVIDGKLGFGNRTAGSTGTPKSRANNWVPHITNIAVYYYYDIYADTLVSCFSGSDYDNGDREYLGHTSAITNEHGTWLTSTVMGSYCPGIAILDTSTFNPHIVRTMKNNPWLGDTNVYHLPIAALYNSTDSSLLKIRGANGSNKLYFDLLNKDLTINKQYCLGSGCSAAQTDFIDIHKTMLINGKVVMCGDIKQIKLDVFAKVIDYHSGKEIAIVSGVSGTAATMDTAGAYLYISGTFKVSFGPKTSQLRVIRVDTSNWRIDTTWFVEHNKNSGSLDFVTIASNIMALTGHRNHERVIVDLVSRDTISFGFDTIPYIYKMMTIGRDSILLGTSSGLLLATKAEVVWKTHLIVSGDIGAFCKSERGVYYSVSHHDWPYTIFERLDFKYCYLHFYDWEVGKTTKTPITCFGQITNLLVLKDNLILSGSLHKTHLNVTYDKKPLLPLIKLKENILLTKHTESDTIDFYLPQSYFARKVIGESVYYLTRLPDRSINGFELKQLDLDLVRSAKWLFEDSTDYSKIINLNGIMMFDVYKDTLYIVCDGLRDSILVYDMKTLSFVKSCRFFASNTTMRDGYMSISDSGGFVFGSTDENYYLHQTIGQTPFTWKKSNPKDQLGFSKILLRPSGSYGFFEPHLQGKYLIYEPMIDEAQYLVLHDVVSLEHKLYKLKLNDVVNHIQIVDTFLYVCLDDTRNYGSVLRFSLKNPELRPYELFENIKSFIIDGDIMYYVGKVSVPKTEYFISAKNLLTGEKIWKKVLDPDGRYDFRFWIKDDLLILGHWADNSETSYENRIQYIFKSSGNLLKTCLLPKQLTNGRSWQIVGHKVYFKNAINGNIGCFDLFQDGLDFDNLCYQFSGSVDRIQFDNERIYVVTKQPFNIGGKEHYYTEQMLSSWPCHKDNSIRLEHFSPKVCGQGQIQFEFAGINITLIDSLFLVDTYGDTTWLNDSLVKRQGNSKMWLDLNLSNSVLGRYQIIGMTSGNYYSFDEGYFELKKSEPPKFEIQMNIPNAIRPYKGMTSQVVISNTGNLDAFGVPIYLLVSKEFETITLPAQSLDAYSLNFALENSNEYKIHGDPLYERVYVWVVPKIAAMSSQILDIEYSIKKFSAINPTVNYKFMVGEEIGNNRQLLKFDSSWTRYTSFLECIYGQAKDITCVDKIVKQPLVRFINSSKDNFSIDLNSIKGYNSVTRSIDVVISPDNLFQKYVSLCYDTVGLDSSIERMINQLIGHKNSCDSVEHLTDHIVSSYSGKTTIVNSWDPNNKLGPTGSLGHSYTNSLPNRFLFVINFENDSSASAPAQIVRIEDYIDTSMFEFKSLEFLSFSVGDIKRYFNTGTSSLNQLFNLEKETGVYLNIVGAIDSTTGKLSVLFSSINPKTGKDDIAATSGFLAPNKIDNEGQGSISFFLSAKSGINLDAAFTNKAKIFFDSNEEIVTNTWEIQYDSTPPSSSIRITGEDNSNYYNLTWSGSDSISGILYYDILYSTKGEPYSKLLERTTNTTSTVALPCNETTYFYSIAYDSAGNIENKTDFDIAINSNCDSTNDFAFNLNMHLVNESSNPQYFGPNTKENRYKIKSQISSKSQDTIGLKDLSYVIQLSSDYKYDHLVFDSISINNKQYRLNRNSGDLLFESDTMNYSFSKVGPTTWRFNIFNTVSTYNRNEGFTVLKGLEDNLTIILDLTIYGMLANSDSNLCNLEVIPILNQNRFESENVNLVYDKSIPVLKVDSPLRKWTSPATVKWQVVDSLSGLASTSIEIYKNGQFFDIIKSSKSKDSINIYAPKSQLVKLVFDVCDLTHNCDISRSITFNQTLTASELFKSSVIVMPNPNNGSFMFQNLPRETIEVCIYDKVGKLISRFLAIDDDLVTLDLSAGIYTVRIIAAENSSNLKMIVRP